MGRMERTGTSGGFWLLRLALGVLLLLAVQGVQCEHEPTESECRPYIEKALKEHHADTEEVSGEPLDTDASPIEQEENPPIDEAVESNEEQASSENKSQEDEVNEGSTEEQTAEQGAEGDAETNEDTGESLEGPDGEEENKTEEQNDTAEESTTTDAESVEGDTTEESNDANTANENEGNQKNQEGDSADAESGSQEGDTAEAEVGSQEADTVEAGSQEAEAGDASSQETETAEAQAESQEGDTTEADGGSQEGDTAEAEGGSQEGDTAEAEGGSQEGDTAEAEGESQEGDTAEADGGSQEGDTAEAEGGSQEGDTAETEGVSQEVVGGSEGAEGDAASQEGETMEDDTAETAEETDDNRTGDVSDETKEAVQEESAQEGEGSGDQAEDSASKSDETATAEADTTEDTTEQVDEATATEEVTTESGTEAAEGASQETAEATEEGDKVETEEPAAETTEGSPEDSAQEVPEEDLTKEVVIPANLRSREHITQILKLDEESVEKESALAKTIDNTLKSLKNLYDSAIKPLEILYKYRDLSNRHFGDPEIFSKPLILFMGPWSGGKSSTLNYLLDLEFTEMALRTGAEPSPAYFNILTYGEDTEILDGTQLAADWTFSGLQKFGQGLLDRLRGVRMPNRLLEKVNIVEIPGILEIRKQVQRLFPFNDACQWFIDRADIIFLVYDPAKLDVGPETEAILDQLKGREYQTRIILNKADQVKPEELMRVQGTLIWNISPLMSSQEPPVMYTTSLWSLPYEASAPARLLLAQERAFLRDLRDAIDRRVENKIASARRFAVRVRNHAKMVDCYLTTYYNHKTFFGNRKKTADDIIENPQKYHIYEGLSTLTNISRYDLPDPEMYRDFFRINPLYDFTKLSDTCTYFRGCPINKLDIAIAYDLPELIGKYKKAVEAAKTKS